ncbi:MFS general substrate transporter [Stereum hirsutum FP-91666 SS1]|uniref:MFS general substrate transporter n=1 Tax=Stereum hirsutum (strain FP-91666) TaxID=721885 RepID=UPI000440CCEB|nr:MFS general substrate transporter [Stereum hirsutum FP-91666 SS1]EIM89330.1 MFS general substrate transporter [Stereum hirsutum FP-91666 SS1]
METTATVERKSPASSHLEKDPKVYSDVVSVDEKRDLQKLDRAAEFLANYRAEHGEVPPLTPKEEKAMIRRFDLLLVPLLTITSTLGALDKVAVGQADIYGMATDANLVGQQYSWISSGIYIGTIIGALPQMWLMKRFTTSKYIAVNVFMWGVLTMCMSACKNFKSLIALRIILGLFESIVMSSSLLILSGFYKRAEQPARTAVCFSTFSSVFNGFIGYGSSFSPSDARLAPWKILFIACGGVTAIVGILNFFFLPSTVMDAVWMKSPLKRAQALDRVKDEQLGTENHIVKWEQVREAFTDPKTYFVFAISLLNNIPNGGLIGFNSIVIKSLGYTSRITSLLTIPTGVISFIASFFFSWLAGHTTRYRTVIAAISVIPPMIGVIVLHVLPLENHNGRLAGIYVLYTYWSPYILGQAIMLNNTAGLTKKTVVYAINYIGYSVGNLVGPQTFLTNEAPAYSTAIKTMLCCYAIDALLFLAYGFYCRYLNRRKAAHLASQASSLGGSASEKDGEQVPELMDDALADLTDLKNPHFVYIT